MNVDYVIEIAGAVVYDVAVFVYYLAVPRYRAGWLELSPAGYGIHWPLVDEDLAVGPLIKSVDPMAA